MVSLTKTCKKIFIFPDSEGLIDCYDVMVREVGLVIEERLEMSETWL